MRTDMDIRSLGNLAPKAAPIPVAPSQSFRSMLARTCSLATPPVEVEAPLPTKVELPEVEPFEGLKRGARSADVSRVQKVLAKWNDKLGVKDTGRYDEATQKAMTLYKAIYGGEGGGAEIDHKTAAYLRQMEDGSFWDNPPEKSPAQAMLYHASRQLGVPYRLGGDGKSSTDCGMLTSSALRQAGVDDTPSRLADLQYLAARQNQGGLSFRRQHPESGDLVFFNVPTRQSHLAYNGVTHVGMYVGDGLMLAASSSAGKVVMQPVDQLGQYVAGYGRPEGPALAGL
ncbi:MAG: C40 family peptidase [Candidatus Eremiobacteraeota bacterium]|nr:C40 family peptidase [Candidatus Eremiobacteraeota bacterium]